MLDYQLHYEITSFFLFNAYRKNKIVLSKSVCTVHYIVLYLH